MRCTKTAIAAGAAALVLCSTPAQAVSPAHTSGDTRKFIAWVHYSVPDTVVLSDRSLHKFGDTICNGFDNGVTVYDMLSIVEPDDALDVDDMSNIIVGSVKYLCRHEQHHIDDIIA